MSSAVRRRVVRPGCAVLAMAVLVMIGALAAFVPASAAPLLPALARADIATGAFTQRRYLPQLERPIISRGTFAYDVERGLLWQVREPVESTLVIDDSGAYQNGERLEDSRVLGAIRPIFGALFGGDTGAVEQHFTIGRETAGDAWRLRLMPRDAALASALETIVITGERTVHQLVIVAADGGRTELRFDQVDYPQRLEPAQRRAFERAR